jgi:hypothetical protein
MFAQKEGRRACAEPRNVIWKGGDEEADGETTRSESLDGWNKFQLLATGRETRVSWRRRRGGMDAKKMMDGWIGRYLDRDGLASVESVRWDTARLVPTR